MMSKKQDSNSKYFTDCNESHFTATRNTSGLARECEAKMHDCRKTERKEAV